MNDSKLSYIITANAPESLNKKFWEIKKKFNLFVDQEKVHADSIITLNIAHITIKRRFYLKPGFTEEELFASLDTVAKRAIPIEADTLEVFKTEKYGNVPVALVKKTEELQRLHEEILRAVLPYVDSEMKFEGTVFKPHLSVVYNAPDEKVHEIASYTKKKILPVSYMLNNLYVLKNIPGIEREREIVRKYLFK